jgi:hypothetical protein
MRIRILVILWRHKKLDFDMKNMLYETYHTYVGKKNLVTGWKSGLFVNFGKFSCSWIRIQILNMDPDPGETNQCGSGSETLRYTLLKC